MPDMTFEMRLKGNLTEAIVKALLVDDGYRVVDSGIEHFLREVSCLSQCEYSALSITKGLRKLPDLIVMNKGQTKAHLVEVKYRQRWNPLLISDLREQVAFFNKIILVCVIGEPPHKYDQPSGATHLRAIPLKYEDGLYMAQKYTSQGEWTKGDLNWTSLDEGSEIQWLDLAPMQFVFDEMTSNAHHEGHPKKGLNVNTLLSCRAVFSLMDPNIWKL